MAKPPNKPNPKPNPHRNVGFGIGILEVIMSLAGHIVLNPSYQIYHICNIKDIHEKSIETLNKIYLGIHLSVILMFIIDH